MFGIDQLITSPGQIKKARAGFLTNHAVLSSNGLPASIALLRNGFNIIKLFSPEHGVQSQGEDGVTQPDVRDTLTGLPVMSLYGEKMKPSPGDLKDLDVMLIDLPNIGCRFYTYWWTATLMVETCAEAGKKVIFLDRPNLSDRMSKATEGPLLDETNCSSFLGRWRMPLTYSYTYGQLMRWFVRQKHIAVDLEVIGFYEESDVLQSFIPPSPSMPEKHTTQIYPCTGLFEGVNISSGRGTSFPFKIFGAPWIDPLNLQDDFAMEGFRGIESFPFSFQPAWSIYQGDFCHGLLFHVRDPEIFRPVACGIWLLNYLSVRYPEKLKPSPYPTTANPSGDHHLDRLLGIPHSFSRICSGKSLPMPDILKMVDLENWTHDVDSFLTSQHSLKTPQL